MVNKDTISEIYSNKFFEKLPCFNKDTLSTILGKKGEALNYWAKRLVLTGKIIPLKNGLYTGHSFLLGMKEAPNIMESYLEYLASVLRQPSYLSLEYMLGKYGLIMESPCALTSVTIKSTRMFTNGLGSFVYRNIKEDLFCGHLEESFKSMRYFAATPAKALFDFIYLKKLGRKNLKQKVCEEMRINWDAFGRDDLAGFEAHVSRAKSKKMEQVLKIILKEKLVT